jgi:hypothetical protein
MMWELLVSTPTSKRRKTILWDGSDGEDAARRFVDCHRRNRVGFPTG